MLKSRRSAAVLAALLLMISLASACDEKRSPTETNDCTDTSGESCVRAQ